MTTRVCRPVLWMISLLIVPMAEGCSRLNRTPGPNQDPFFSVTDELPPNNGQAWMPVGSKPEPITLRTADNSTDGMSPTTRQTARVAQPQ